MRQECWCEGEKQRSEKNWSRASRSIQTRSKVTKLPISLSLHMSDGQVHGSCAPSPFTLQPLFSTRSIFLSCAGM